MEALYGPGCFGTGPLAASVCSEAPPYPPGTTFSLFTLFHASDFPIFTPFHSFSSPGLPLHSLALQRPNCLAGVRRVAGVEKEGNPSCALIGRFWRHLCSHWSAPSAASAWGEGTDCKCGRECKGCLEICTHARHCSAGFICFVLTTKINLDLLRSEV